MRFSWILRQLARKHLTSLFLVWKKLVLLSSNFVFSEKQQQIMVGVKQISSNRVAKNNDCSVTFNNTNSITEPLMELSTQDERRAPRLDKPRTKTI